MFHDGFMGGMWFGWIFWIVLFVLIIWGVVQFGNRSQSNKNQNLPRESSLDILKKRYASGKISKEKFEEMRKDLSNGKS